MDKRGELKKTRQSVNTQTNNQKVYYNLTAGKGHGFEVHYCHNVVLNHYTLIMGSLITLTQERLR